MTASAVRGQSASQNLQTNTHAVTQRPAGGHGDGAGNWTYRAETLVVKLAQSFAYKSLVVPVMSSHWAGAVPPTEGGRGHTRDSSPQTGLQEETDEGKNVHQCKVALKALSCTYDGAKQTQAGGVALPGVPRALPPGRGQGDAQSDGSVELAPARLNGDHGAKVRLVTQQLGHQLIRNRLSLRFKTTDEMGSAYTGRGPGRSGSMAEVWDERQMQGESRRTV